MFRFLFILLFILSCREKSLNNACDINSESYKNSVIIYNLLGMQISNCSAGIVDFNSSVIFVNRKEAKFSEGGGDLTLGSPQTFTVQLRRKPISNVEIQLVFSDLTYITVSQLNLSFDSQSWSIPQTFYITAKNDNLLNGSRNISLQLIAKSDDKDLDLTPIVIPIEVLDNEKRLFVSTNAYMGGSFGGISGADTICSSDIKCPLGSTCKAMILGSTRIASQSANLGDGQVNWVLHPNAHYYLTDNATLIANTNSSSLLQIPFFSVMDATAPGTWLGSNSGWVLGANSCSDWTDNTNTVTGYMFRTQFTNSTLFGGNFNCNNPVNLFCVEY
ncbi:DUF1554 domain-containing protein [Leptospira bandrabouensis]|uniref:DUF1554 domain-containing protein n=1 Tax=Leptospira bandrabouensis TaxID=2484903 RepID=A0A6H3NNX1_9LEPT|nr:DUF1554 domain-containing protein [Leptospira bandrabouensis]MCG6151550.1 DUF1554 domain-containing protein [Leptospira bandrabouensis]TGN04683.1 DUF1554 domain-containing protein [Leptospira bandrabouensis]TGN15012.1 DUF1554 domain-containing protein [Leptospira bandrabouensis]